MQTSGVVFKVHHSLVACGIHRFEKPGDEMGLHCRAAGQTITPKALTSAWSISATALLAICWDWGSLRVGRSISLLIALKGASAFKIISSYSCSASERYVMAPPTPISALVGVMTANLIISGRVIL